MHTLTLPSELQEAADTASSRQRPTTELNCEECFTCPVCHCIRTVHAFIDSTEDVPECLHCRSLHSGLFLEQADQNAEQNRTVFCTAVGYTLYRLKLDIFSLKKVK